MLACLGILFPPKKMLQYITGSEDFTLCSIYSTKPYFAPMLSYQLDKSCWFDLFVTSPVLKMRKRRLKVKPKTLT